MIDLARVTSISRLQDGLITRQQALASGMSPKALQHRLRQGGPWRRVLRGVYATFDGPLADIHLLRWPPWMSTVPQRRLA
ncbi:type IV toxin-antitoxin system AbiEi family antitoxin domain-containing protein [Phytoactinopolyspora alkaliphila]|uniref:Type IV toxin-antitoxin system AbiEi family antitoxin domain-containing protein n=1 Tax=Phytoactinopolyspora alkaliphila TaxID=1783498 RepID=A0A6N9YMT9_9ACTN|nr:type IV toxin-antitoxin system AbiEi family antitoxin domain-containing protein [Phytoactinopolyspora alkaliphila]NED96294.1 type IV toxin-antitoxin system AbiEi family antitoxin domain-containing protein [Phytoactinopolyspora alkaliphila]